MYNTMNTYEPTCPILPPTSRATPCDSAVFTFAEHAFVVVGESFEEVALDVVFTLGITFSTGSHDSHHNHVLEPAAKTRKHGYTGLWIEQCSPGHVPLHRDTACIRH